MRSQILPPINSFTSNTTLRGAGAGAAAAGAAPAAAAAAAAAVAAANALGPAAGALVSPSL